jgi:hypothetical protein
MIVNLIRLELLHNLSEATFERLLILLAEPPEHKKLHESLRAVRQKSFHTRRTSSFQFGVCYLDYTD